MSVAATITQYDHCRTVHLSGQLDFGARAELRSICEAAAEKPEPHLVVDLTQVVALDRGSIRLLEMLATDTLGTGAIAVFVAPTQTLRLMLSAYGLRASIHRAASVEAAARLVHASRATSVTA